MSLRSCAVVRCLALLCVLFAPCATSVARSLQISQYGHSAWRLADGVFPASLYAIAQTLDGYLWIGTTAGLLRFDGVRFTNFSEIEDALPLPSNAITALLGASDGSLWVGTRAGLSRWADGTLSNVQYPVDLVPSKIAESAGGDVWVTNFDRNRERKARSPLCRVLPGSYRCFSEDEGLAYRGDDFSLGGLAFDLDGSLVLGTASSVLRWKPGEVATPFELFGADTRGAPRVVDIARDPNGFFWVGVQGDVPVRGLMQLKAGVLATVRIGGFDGATLSVTSLLVDRSRAIWVGTKQGLWHIAEDKVDRYTSGDGLTSDDVKSLFEDREGNVWVATTNGLDMFRSLPVVRIGKREGLSEDHVDTIMGSRNNELWATDGNTINIVGPAGVRSIGVEDGVPGQQITSLLEDPAGSVWVGVDNGLYVLDGHDFREVKRGDGRQIGRVASMARDVDESILALTLTPERRLFRFRNSRVINEAVLPDSPPVRTLAAGSSGIWLGLLGRFSGDFAKYEDRALKEVVTFEHSPESFVQRLTVESDGSVYGSTRIGLAAWRNGRKQMLTKRNGLPCAYLYTHIFDEHGDLWLFAECGLMQVARDEVEAWWRDSERVVKLRHLDPIDGAHSGYVPFVASSRTSDGRLWFTDSTSVLTIDPNHIAANDVPAKVIVERITANGKTRSAKSGLRLGPLLRNLQIDYTATSLAVPQRVQFRYKLQGKEEEWTDAGTRRQAFYNDLDPGSYTFQISACNSGGVWNPAIAEFPFVVAPAWYQTTLSHVVALILAMAAICALYVARVRQIKRAMHLRFSERLEERNRIARELHDTLLQTIQGSKMVADGVLHEHGDRDRLRWALEKLSEWLERAVREVRAAVDSLRVPVEERDDLTEAFRRAAAELSGVQPMEISLSTEGTPAELGPALRSELYRIGYEAIRNACAHAQAKKLTIRLVYGKDFELVVTDDGSGIDEDTRAQGKPGHFGLRGMRERASRIGASLSIRSTVGAGTSVHLIVPRREISRSRSPL